MEKLNPELSKLLEDLSKKLDLYNENEYRQRLRLELQAWEQGIALRCPECDAFVPLRPDNVDEEGRRICLFCRARFFQEEY